MAIELYYFSGTGNCLSAARTIAANIGGVPISIPEVVDKPDIATHADTIGIVFPAYLAHLHGVPLIVERFVRKLQDIQAKYLFAVCTCGGYEIVNAVPSLKSLSRVVRAAGGRLEAEYTLRLPMNNLSYDHIPVPIERNSQVILSNSRARLDDICRRISKSKPGKHHFLRTLVNAVMIPLYGALHRSCLVRLKELAKEPPHSTLNFRELIPMTDRSIKVDDTCTGCGICMKVCPVQNIVLVEGRPVWQHRCEMCFACDEWCPQESIHHWGRADGVKYHHPQVTVRDMFREQLPPAQAIRIRKR